MSDDGWSRKVSFRAISDFLESVFRESSKPKKKEKSERFLAACRSQMDSEKTDSLFPILRCFFLQISNHFDCFILDFFCKFHFISIVFSGRLILIVYHKIGVSIKPRRNFSGSLQTESVFLHVLA